MLTLTFTATSIAQCPIFSQAIGSPSLRVLTQNRQRLLMRVEAEYTSQKPFLVNFKVHALFAAFVFQQMNCFDSALVPSLHYKFLKCLTGRLKTKSAIKFVVGKSSIKVLPFLWNECLTTFSVPLSYYC